jgi:hypothetical protein
LAIGESCLRAAPDLTEGAVRIALVVDLPQASKKQAVVLAVTAEEEMAVRWVAQENAKTHVIDIFPKI